MMGYDFRYWNMTGHGYVIIELMEEDDGILKHTQKKTFEDDGMFF